MTADIEQRFAAGRRHDGDAGGAVRRRGGPRRGATKQLAVMQKLFSTWLDGQVQAARQSMDRPQQCRGWVGGRGSTRDDQTRRAGEAPSQGAAVRRQRHRFGLMGSSIASTTSSATPKMMLWRG